MSKLTLALGIVALIIALFCVYLTVALRNDIVKGKVSIEEIRLYKGGSHYKIDQIEDLGMNKHFLSFKEE